MAEPLLSQQNPLRDRTSAVPTCGEGADLGAAIQGVQSSVLERYAKLADLLNAAKSLDFTVYEAATRHYLEQQSLTHQVAVQITTALLHCYGMRLAAQMEDTEPITLDFAGVIVSFNPALDEAQFQSQSDYSQVVRSSIPWLEQLFTHNRLWDFISAEVWRSLLIWTIQDLEISTSQSLLEDMAQRPFCEALWRECIYPVQSEQRAEDFILSYWVSQISTQILQVLEPEQWSSNRLEQFLGLVPSVQSRTLDVPVLPPLQAIAPEVWLEFLQQIFAEPSSLETSGIKTLDLAAPDAIAPELSTPQQASGSLPVARPDGDNPDPNLEPDPISDLASDLVPDLVVAPHAIEHYLTRPQDLAVLPWELLTQIKQHYGLALLQLQYLWAAHAMAQSSPQDQSFTLKASDMRIQLDWNPTQAAPHPPDLLGLIHQFGAMQVSSLWMTDPRSSAVDAFQVRGSLWEVLSEDRGNLNWTTGKLESPDQVYVTLRPGLWVSRLLALGGTLAKQAFLDFGTLALNLLRLNYCKAPLLLSLLTHLMLREALLREQEQRPTESVRDLLTVVLPYSADTDWTIQPQQAATLIQAWHQALEALLVLGWRPKNQTLQPQPHDFYGQSCPSWLQSLSQSWPKDVQKDAPKDLPKDGSQALPQEWPQEWIEQWLALPVELQPPLRKGSRGFMDSQTTVEPRVDQRGASVRLRFDRLTGAEVRSARKALRLTQSQLAETLHVHQSLIAKIEAGQRSVSDDLEESLRKVLAL
ncbi:MAG: helix-turn-helix domain-containing protein [Thermosynechococcaceae cyanobacterium MS004]|nr:helix-turn-helix domain-containing protein [Thermosynechococcaceae cyanobacterium MS004]